MLAHSNYIVLGTASRNERTELVNSENVYTLGVELDSIVGKHSTLNVLGCYDGGMEASFAISCTDFYDTTRVIGLILQDKYSQECALVYDRRSEVVSLVYPDGTLSLIGSTIRQATTDDVGYTDYTAFEGGMYIAF